MMAGKTGMEGLEEFIAGLEEDAKAVERDVQMIASRMALGILGRVVLASPVKSGRFRGNWFVGVDFTPDDITEDTDKEGNATIARGQAVIEAAQAFSVIEIVNNLPYGPRLNHGWSAKAPAGFVDDAVDAEAGVFA